MEQVIYWGVFHTATAPPNLPRGEDRQIVF